MKTIKTLWVIVFFIAIYPYITSKSTSQYKDDTKQVALLVDSAYRTRQIKDSQFLVIQQKHEHMKIILIDLHIAQIKMGIK